MKKTLAVLIALTMLFSMAIPALAAPVLPETEYKLPEVNYLSDIEQALVDLVDVDYALEVLDRIPLRRTPGSWGNALAREVFLEEYEKWYPGQAFVVSHPMNNGNNATPDVPTVAMDDGWVKIGDKKFVYYGQGPNSGSPGPYSITAHNNDPYQYPTAYKFRGKSFDENSQVKNTTGVEFIEWEPTTWTGTGTATFPELAIPDGLNVAGKTVVVLNTAAKNTPNTSTATGGSPNTGQGTMTAQPSAANFYNAALTLQNAEAAAVVFSTAQTADAYWHTVRQYWVPEGDAGFYRIPNTNSSSAHYNGDITIPVGLVPYGDTHEEFARIRALPQAERDALQMEIGMETNYTLNTVMCLKPAADPNETRTVWIGGHYDSHLYGSRNDNGSGTSMMLAIAKAFKDIPTKFNIMFVNWDWEESGYGSSYFCRQLMTEEQKDNFVAYLNLDMAATSASINDLLMFSGPGYRVNPAGTSNNIPRGGGLEGNVTSGGSYAGATGTLVKGEYPLDFVGGRKVAEEFTTVYNILNNFVYTSKKYGLGMHDISISNGGSSDHAQFYNQRAVVDGVVTRPNLLNSMHMDWRPKVKPHPSGTDGLEVHWHKEGDDWANICRNRFKVSGDSLSLMLAGAAGAEGFVLPGALSFNLVSDRQALLGGESFTLTPSFENTINTNAYILNFKYDKDLFSFSDANAEANAEKYGLNILSSEETADGWKVTVGKLSGYGVTTLGEFLFTAANGFDDTSASVIEATIEYVNKDDNEKLLLTSFDYLDFANVVIPKPGWTLIDLSNLIDWFGVKIGDTEWDLAKVWNFGGNKNEIDIYDITFVASRIDV